MLVVVVLYTSVKIAWMYVMLSVGKVLQAVVFIIYNVLTILYSGTPEAEWSCKWLLQKTTLFFRLDSTPTHYIPLCEKVTSFAKCWWFSLDKYVSSTIPGFIKTKVLK